MDLLLLRVKATAAAWEAQVWAEAWGVKALGEGLGEKGLGVECCHNHSLCQQYSHWWCDRWQFQ